MKRLSTHARLKLATLASFALLASGCATVNFERNLAQTNLDVASLAQGKLAWVQTEAQRSAAQQAANAMLKAPLQQTDAVHLALLGSPALQALLSQSMADAAQAAQSGRIAGSQLQLSEAVVTHLSTVRSAWVEAVAAKQALHYAAQVNASAAASAELAKRMAGAGNFNTLQRARQHSFYADASAQWAAAKHAATAAHEALVRALGLSAEQAAQLSLPDRLPDLPKAPQASEQIASQFTAQRLDVRMAQHAYNAAAKAQGLTALTSFTDVELALRRDSVRDLASGSREPRTGVELALRLPIFDWGNVQRQAMNAQTLAAANQLEAVQRAASSHLREAYSAYRSGYDLAKHYRDEIIPLRQTMADETLLAYNGMLIGVFELLADSRDRLAAVTAAIAAQRQFWLADAALASTVLGKATGGGGMSAPKAAKSEGGGH